MLKLNIQKEKEVLADDLFNRLKDARLIDKYMAYQILSDCYEKIEVDLEIIQTEGFEATKKVDPNYVIKKKNGVDAEVQDGWVGHILPFDIVQKELLKDELKEIEGINNKIDEINDSINELIENLSTEDAESVLNEDKTEFSSKDLKKAYSEIDTKEKYDENSFEYIVIKAIDCFTELKKFKDKLKIKEKELIEKTINNIENLPDKTVKELLDIKWFRPIIENINTMPTDFISAFASDMKNLSIKYANTYENIEKDIKETSESLACMLKDLTGSEYDMKGVEELKSLL